MAEMLGSLSDRLNDKTMQLVYMYYFSTTASDSSWKLSIDDMFGYLSATVLKDPRFSEVIDAGMRSKIESAKTELDDGAKQLTGPNISRLILTVSLPAGSDASTDFIRDLSAACKGSFGEDFYLVGDSSMVYEMTQSFNKDLNLITILTAISIFIVVALTFRSLLIPLILVLIVQGGVYLTICIIGAQGSSIYYLALLIVQCILMGATIDYAILFTNYYREARQSMERREALIAAYNGSVHTILTSGLIMMLVTGIIGYAFANPTIGQICQTISKGAFSAVVLIVFILPGILATFDKFIIKRKKS